jgi:hypothetical protein
MIRTILGLAVAGVALAPFAEKAGAPKAEAPWVAEYGVDPIVTSTGRDVPSVRHLKVATQDGQCLLSVISTLNSPSIVRAEPSCGDVYAGLDKASVWTSAGETGRIADAAGRLILEIGASDGFAYEGTSASGGVVTLTEADI